jgi:hypothetical protein
MFVYREVNGCTNQRTCFEPSRSVASTTVDPRFLDFGCSCSKWTINRQTKFIFFPKTTAPTDELRTRPIFLEFKDRCPGTTCIAKNQIQFTVKHTHTQSTAHLAYYTTSILRIKQNSIINKTTTTFPGYRHLLYVSFWSSSAGVVCILTSSGSSLDPLWHRQHLLQMGSCIFVARLQCQRY